MTTNLAQRCHTLIFIACNRANADACIYMLDARLRALFLLPPTITVRRNKKKKERTINAREKERKKKTKRNY